MQSGKLRHIIEIQEPTRVQDSTGDPIATWATIATRRASIAPLSGRELTNALQVSAEVTHKITIRGQGLSVSPTYRILFGERIFEIVSSLNTEEKGLEIILLAIERVA